MSPVKQHANIATVDTFQSISVFPHTFDTITGLHPRILLGIVETRSVNVNSHLQTLPSETFEKDPKMLKFRVESS